MVEEGEGVIAAALMTPPHNPVLSLGFTPECIRLLAEDLHRSYPMLPGVLGPVDAAHSFAETWSTVRGQPYRKMRAQRVHQLDSLHGCLVAPPTLHPLYPGHNVGVFV
jgi:hypothetical protein